LGTPPKKDSSIIILNPAFFSIIKDFQQTFLTDAKHRIEVPKNGYLKGKLL